MLKPWIALCLVTFVHAQARERSSLRQIEQRLQAARKLPLEDSVRERQKLLSELDAFIARSAGTPRDLAPALLDAGQLRRQLGDATLAERDLRRVLELRSESSVVHAAYLELAALHRALGRVEPCIAVLTSAVDAAGGNYAQKAAALLQLARVLRSDQRLDAAKTAYRQLLELPDPRASTALTGLDEWVALLIKEGRPAEARSVFTEASKRIQAASGSGKARERTLLPLLQTEARLRAAESRRADS